MYTKRLSLVAVGNTNMLSYSIYVYTKHYFIAVSEDPQTQSSVCIQDVEYGDIVVYTPNFLLTCV